MINILKYNDNNGLNKDNIKVLKEFITLVININEATEYNENRQDYSFII